MSQRILMLGGICTDRTLVLDQIPQPGQDVLVRDMREQPGGCALNAAWMMKKLGLDPWVYSFVGKETLPEMLSFFRSAGLTSDCLFCSEQQRSGVCQILVDSHKERTFLTWRGCEGRFDARRIPDNAGFCAAYLTGLFLLYGTESRIAADYLCLQNPRLPLFFDPGPLCGQIPRDLLEKLLRRCSGLKVNRSEAEILQQSLQRPLQDYFRDRLEFILLTNGAAGLSLIRQESSVVQPAIQGTVIDTSGAGDACFAGLIASDLCGVPEPLALSLAAACGTATVAESGPRSSLAVRQLFRLAHPADPQVYFSFFPDSDTISI